MGRATVLACRDRMSPGEREAEPAHPTPTMAATAIQTGRAPPAAGLAPRTALSHMDLLRGLSAVAVLLGHVRGLLYVDYQTLPSRSVGIRALYLLTGFQHQAVVVFFVLSGFFIGSSVLRSNAAHQWSWGSYLTRRFTRLYVVLVPALILTLVLDSVGMHFFGADNIYGGKLDAPMLVLTDARTTSGVACFVGNLAFLQYMFVQPYGTNSPLWSLGYEFWSYITFPLLFAVAARSSSVRTRLVAGVVAAPILFIGSGDFIKYFGIWLFGALVATSWKRVASDRVIPNWLVAPGLLLFLTIVTIARATVSHPIVRDYVTAAFTAGFLLLLLCRTPMRSASERYARFATGLAGFSYTLYLIHFPIVALINAAVIGVHRWPPTPPYLALGGLLCSIILALAYSLAQLTERHTEAVRVQVDLVRANISGRILARTSKGT
jgi:peptidoglycan/LPS O-acetylase OafA/YrhL